MTHTHSHTHRMDGNRRWAPMTVPSAQPSRGPPPPPIGCRGCRGRVGPCYEVIYCHQSYCNGYVVMFIFEMELVVVVGKCG